MYVVLGNIEPLKDFIDLIYDSSNTIKLVFNDKGLSINLLNDSHIAFYNAKYNKEFFDEYDVTGLIELVVDTQDLQLILKYAKKDELLTIRCDDEANIEFIFESDNRRVFTIGLVDELYESPVPPELDYPIDFLMEWEELKQSCTDLDKIVGTDRFILNFKGDGCYVTSPVDAMHTYEHRLNNESYDTARTIVNVDYLNRLLKLKKHGTITFHAGNDMPLNWSVSDSFEVNPDYEFSGLIAPILEDME